MVKEGLTVGRKEAVIRGVGSEIPVASVSKRITKTENGGEWGRGRG